MQGRRIVVISRDAPKWAAVRMAMAQRMALARIFAVVFVSVVIVPKIARLCYLRVTRALRIGLHRTES